MKTIDPSLVRAKMVLNNGGKPSSLSKRQRALVLIEAIGGPLGDDFLLAARSKPLEYNIFAKAWDGMVNGSKEFDPEALVVAHHTVMSVVCLECGDSGLLHTPCPGCGVNISSDGRNCHEKE